MLKDIEYWKQKNIIHVSDNVVLSKIVYICNLFDIPINKVKMGFQWRGGFISQINPNYSYWWPIGYKREREGKRIWQNKIYQNGLYIQEYHTDVNINREHYNEYKNSKQKRPTFFKDLRDRDLWYKFYGVYCVDTVKSNATDGLYWKRISKGFNIKECHEL